MRTLEGIRIAARGRGRSGSGRRDGWTVLEIVVSTVILLIVLVGFSYGLVSSTSLAKGTREQEIACAEVRARIEELRATTFEEVFARFNHDSDDDPATGASPGAFFDVAGLTPQPDDPDGKVGEILFPVSEDGELREDLDRPDLGEPLDLTGEGDVDDLDHSGDYRILPVLVQLRWRGAAGDCALNMATILKRMRP